jgi:murein L,D-transpeptidase YcbB/YkuD
MGKRVIKLTESDIQKIVERVISEQGMMPLKFQAQNALEKTGEFLKKGAAGMNYKNNTTTELAKGDVVKIVGSVIDGVTKSSVSGVPAALKEFPNSKVYFVIDPKTRAQRYFQYTKDGKTNTKKGNWNILQGKMTYQDDVKTEPSKAKEIGGVRVAPTENFVKSGRAFVESTMSGEIVRKIQQALISQGFLKITKPTSYFGSKTDAAVKNFQKAKGLKVDGKVGKDTYNALFTAPATPAEPEKQVPQDIINIQPKGLANVTKGIQTPPPITKQGNIQTANYD